MLSCEIKPVFSGRGQSHSGLLCSPETLCYTFLLLSYFSFLGPCWAVTLPGLLSLLAPSLAQMFLPRCILRMTLACKISDVNNWRPSRSRRSGTSTHPSKQAIKAGPTLQKTGQMWGTFNCLTVQGPSGEMRKHPPAPTPTWVQSLQPPQVILGLKGVRNKTHTHTLPPYAPPPVAQRAPGLFPSQAHLPKNPAVLADPRLLTFCNSFPAPPE